METSTLVTELVNEAVARYLRDLEHRTLSDEINAFEKAHPELREKYFQQWVAFHRGQLVDRDDDRSALYRRVRERFGRVSVLIRQVGEVPCEDIHWRGGSLRAPRA